MPPCLSTDKKKYFKAQNCKTQARIQPGAKFSEDREYGTEILATA
jgi:hypothetical protein